MPFCRKQKAIILSSGDYYCDLNAYSDTPIIYEVNNNN